MIFFSTHCYTLGWELGIDEASAEFRRQCETVPDSETLPCVLTLFHLREIDHNIGAWCDTGSTRLAHSRSRAFHDALNSGCDVWISCDDDCGSDLPTLRGLIRAVSDDVPRVVIMPFWGRTTAVAGPRIPLNLDPEHPILRVLPTGEKLHRALTAGLGLTAVNRAALDEIADANSSLRYVDDDGISRIALFLEYIKGDHWLGEDLAFFSRIPTSVTIEALLTGRSSHAGRVLNLDLVAQAAQVELIGVPKMSVKTPG